MATSRDTLRSALAHRGTGAVPIDFGSTSVTGVHVSCVAALRDYYGLPAHPVKVIEPYQMLGLLEEDLLQALGVDVAGVGPRATLFGFPNEDWQPCVMPWGQTVLVSAHFRTTPDGQGGLLIYPQGDTSAPASGHMPASSYFFDTIVRQQPLDETQLNPEDNLEEFGPISDEDLAHFAREVAAQAATGRGIIANFGGTGLGDIALVPAPFLPHPRGIRDIAEWYMATVTEQEYIHAVFTKQTAIALANLAKIYAVVGDAVDAVFICGTDFGTQQGTFCSAQTFRELYLPYYTQLNNWIHANTGWKTFKHSCGAIASFLPLLIEAGFDIINPVQCSAAGMDPQTIKAEFGDRLTFWGGGVDTQRTLPFGAPAEVREEVLRRCETFAVNGGFVFNTVHNIQANTPVENIAAMVDAVKEFNK